MTTPTAGLLARTIAGLAFLSTTVALALRLFTATGEDDPLDLIILGANAVFGTVGWLIVARRPKNTIGWLFLAVAVGISLDALIISLAGLETFSSSSLARVGAWVEGWTWVPLIFVPTIFPLLLFPDGRLPSHRWRPVVWIGALGLVAFSFSMAFDPENYEGGIPIAVRPPPGLVVAASLGSILLLAALFSGLVAIVQRFRRSHGEDRQQLRWLAYAGILGAGSLAASFVVGGVLSTLGVDVDHGPVGDALNLLVLLSMLAIPVAMAVAILKYRLYDIDVVIKKTVVFGILVLLIMGAGFALFFVASLGLTDISLDEGLAVGLAGLAVGTLVWPLYRLARRIADRLVYRGRSSPYEVLSEFSDRMSAAYSTDDVLPRLAAVLGEGTAARLAVVWLRVGQELRVEAVWPPGAAAPRETPPVTVPVVHQGESLGALSVEMPANDPMSPPKARIIRDLAGQAGLVLRNVGLIQELRESRRRIVAAQDERAKKLERNIHDGAQQQLVALAVKIGLVERLVRSDTEKASTMLGEVKGEVNDALETLRALARGIYPPLLADKGLGAALESQARKSSVPVSVEVDGIGRYPQEAEAAVYFSCLEALQNVAKYAKASRATVRLGQAYDSLTFEVIDDGLGFDPETASRGTGLQGIADRLAALGGDLTIRSAPGEGTTITGRLRVEMAP